MAGFFCLYIAHFAAWTLAQSEQALAGQPFAVCERDRVMALSPLAQELGVKVGMTCGRAQSVSTLLVLVERDTRREDLAWAEVQRAFYGLTPKVEPVERGLLFAGVDAKKPAPLLRGWNVCGGFAWDRSTAYLAALSVESGSTRSVPGEKERAFADTIPMEVLASAGISSESIERLRWFGWTRVGHLRALSRRQLEEQFGKEGDTLFHLAQGPRHSNNRRPLATWTAPEEVVSALSFELPAREPAEWNGALDVLLERVCQGLGTRSAQSIEVVVQTPITTVSARRVLKEPISKPQTLHRPVEAALMEALHVLAPLAPIIQGLELRLGGLVCAPMQEGLFPEEKISRAKAMGRTVERLESRFAGRTGRYVLRDPHSPFPEDVYGWRGGLESLQHEEQATKRSSSCKAVK